MYGFLLTLLIIDSLFLSLVILLQSGKGGGLAAMGGGAAATEGVMGGRQAVTFLTRATWVGGTILLVLALILAILSSRSRQPQSILTQPMPGAEAPQPLLPTAPAPETQTEPGGGEPADPGAAPPPDGGAAPDGGDGGAGGPSGG